MIWVHEVKTSCWFSTQHLNASHEHKHVTSLTATNHPNIGNKIPQTLFLLWASSVRRLQFVLTQHVQWNEARSSLWTFQLFHSKRGENVLLILAGEETCRRAVGFCSDSLHPAVLLLFLSLQTWTHTVLNTWTTKNWIWSSTSCLNTYWLNTSCLGTSCMKTYWLNTSCSSTSCLSTSCLNT